MLGWILFVVTLTISNVAIIAIVNHDRQAWNRIRSSLEDCDVGREFLQQYTLAQAAVATIRHYARLMLGGDIEKRLIASEREINTLRECNLRFSRENSRLIQENKSISVLNESLTTENYKLATRLDETNHLLQAWQDWATDWPGAPSKDASLACSIPEEH